MSDRRYASPPLVSDPIILSLAAVLLITVFFLAFPAIDLWFTDLFHDPATGTFPMSRLAAFTSLRLLNDLLVGMVIAVLLLSVVVKLARPYRPTPVAPRDSAFLLSTLIVGPGLVVNALFKENWGRPRPATVEVFGGDAPFVGIWRITDHCTGNCSFVAGEASSAAWLVAVALVLPARWRQPVVTALIVLAVLLSLNRIGFGAHFLSDVLMSWALTALVITVAYRIIIERPPHWLANTRLEAALTRAGERLHSLLRRERKRLQGRSVGDGPR